MLTQNINLRMYRKQARLTQEDVAFISALPDYANISRIETGLRKPDIELLLIYHLLFEMPVDAFFESMVRSLKEDVIDRIQKRINELKVLPKDERVMQRINFFMGAFTRLTGTAETV